MHRRASTGHVVRRAVVAGALLAIVPEAAGAQLYRSSSFVVTDSSVRQGRFEAIARSRDTIVSTYPRAAREVRFRFSLNSVDNEFRPGTEHTIYIRPRNGALTTPVYTFGVEGEPNLPTPEQSASSEDGTARTTFRLDLRPVLRAFRDSGVYHPPYGPPIRRGELQGVYVIGGAAPMTWDVATLHPGVSTQLTDPDGDSVYTVTLPFDASYTRPLVPGGQAAMWARTKSIDAMPRLASPQRLIDALYRMSLEELLQNVRDDGALSAGAKWEGVWTRDVALSSVLGLAFAAPDAVKRSLLAKVDSAGRIIQDTGTGGSWPISTDRTTWALAAWELYAVTGDRSWLRSAYDVIRRSAEADLHVAWDAPLELFHGESSFMDWREQSYPRWMEPADIFQSQSLSTNAVHYATYRILGDMARALGEQGSRWDAIADSLRTGINAAFWQPDRGVYGVYRYGRVHQSVLDRSEGLGEALAIIYGAAPAERRATIARRAPVVEYGTPSFWPYIAHEKLYHNAAVWPFVTAYWNWASAEAGNTAGVEHALGATLRGAALFLTNKENMVASTGHFEGTELTSDRQLWSVAGMLAANYRVLFGMRAEPARLAFRPMVPRAYAGERTLSNLHYRGATLAVTVRGFGNGVASARLDGRPVARAEIPATLTGAHTLELTMNGTWPAERINLVPNEYAPSAPRATLRGDSLAWPAVDGARSYLVVRNGVRGAPTMRTSMRVERSAALTEYQVLARDASGLESFLSEPIRVEGTATELTAAPTGALEREHAGFSGAGYLTLAIDRNQSVELRLPVARAGEYVLDARYANGNGPINTDSKAAVRTLLVDGREVGALVMPQRGQNAWTEWGYSNGARVRLSAGEHRITLRYDAWDANMNRHVNTALLDHLRATLVGP